MKHPHILTVIILLWSVGLAADISTNGSLGQPRQLQESDFTIDASLGKQSGQNLFHSFQHFFIKGHAVAKLLYEWRFNPWS